MRETNESPLISVIVPIHNDADYLERCLNSILGQTYDKLEILLIDDGSVDDSGRICDEYELKDQRVRSVHKLNGGTVSARRHGLQLAQGQLISFIDGDDWIDQNMYEEMLIFWEDNAHPDIISSGLFFEYPQSGTRDEVQDSAGKKRYNKEEIINDLLLELICSSAGWQSKVLTSVCSKMISREVAKGAMQYMSDSLSIGEDGAYVCFLLGCCSSLFITQRAYYHYEQHDNSQNHNYDINVMYKLIELEKVMAEGMDGLIHDSRIQRQIKHYIWGYLEKVINENFHFGLSPFIYLFPYSKCNKGETILIYGAGKVGNSYMRCLEVSGFADKVIWTDQNYKQCQEQGKKVVSLEKALKEKFDHIVIALNDERIAALVMEDMEKRGVAKDKLIWENPVRLYLCD